MSAGASMLVDWLTPSLFAALALGLVLGFALGAWLGHGRGRARARDAESMAEALFEASEDRHRAATEAMLERIKASFGDLSLDALDRSSHQLVRLAEERLGSERGQQTRELDVRKSLIDAQLGRMNEELEKVQGLVQKVEQDRRQGLGELQSQIRLTHEATNSLAGTTQKLREALVGTKTRGQWGERLAEDVLRRAGFVENVNYLKQPTLESGGRPDFTFPLPNDLALHMDVKFPIDNYLRWLEAGSEAERSRLARAFIGDIRAKVRELAGRDYARPGSGSLDYVLLFVPNEPVFGFIHEQAPELIDEALGRRVVICSPATLFAVLAVIRQAVDNFVLARASDEMLRQLAVFRSEWDRFVEQMSQLGRRLDQTREAFDQLATTRARALDRPVAELDSLRHRRGLDVADGEAGEAGDGAAGTGESGAPGAAGGSGGGGSG